MKSTTIRVPIHLHVCPVAGTPLGFDLRARLRSVGYSTTAVNAITEFIGANGTATDSPADAEDVETLNRLIRQHTGETVYDDPADMPACWDEQTWGPTEPFEPSDEDRQWAAENLKRRRPDPRRRQADSPSRHARPGREPNRRRSGALGLRLKARAPRRTFR